MFGILCLGNSRNETLYSKRYCEEDWKGTGKAVEGNQKIWYHDLWKEKGNPNKHQWGEP